MDFETWFNKYKNNQSLNPIDTFNMNLDLAKTHYNYLKEANGDILKSSAKFTSDMDRYFNGDKTIRNFEKTMTPITETITGVDIPENKTTTNFKPTTPTITDSGIVGSTMPNELKDTINKAAEENNKEFEDVRNEEPSNTNSFDDAYQKALEQQKKLWEREDAIRKETQQREDSAFQRAIADMKKAGINPNLVGINPASSGGGITQATRMDNTSTNEELNLLTQSIIKDISNEFEFKENEKDRFTDLLGGALNLLLMKALFKK